MYQTLSKQKNTQKTLNLIVPQVFSLERLCDDLCDVGYSYVKNFLNLDLSEGLLHNIYALYNNDNLYKAKIGQGNNQHIALTIRNNKIYWIEGDNQHEHEFLTVLEKIRLELNRQLFLGLSESEAHYALYEKGGFYGRHLDNFAGKKDRVISLVIYLNKNWQISDGGLLQLYRNPEATEICATLIPDYNHAVFFLSEQIPHEVTVALKDRLSIACWFRCRHMDNNSLIV